MSGARIHPSALYAFLACCIGVTLSSSLCRKTSRDVWSPCRLRLFFLSIMIDRRSRNSSGSIVSDYGLDDRAIGVRSPAGVKDFSSSPCFQTGSGAHPASCTMGTGVKSGRGVMLTTHARLLPRSRISRSYTSSLPKRQQCV
jgi:hypothetical protein